MILVANKIYVCFISTFYYFALITIIFLPQVSNWTGADKGKSLRNLLNLRRSSNPIFRQTRFILLKYLYLCGIMFPETELYTLFFSLLSSLFLFSLNSYLEKVLHVCSYNWSIDNLMYVPRFSDFFIQLSKNISIGTSISLLLLISCLVNLNTFDKIYEISCVCESVMKKLGICWKILGNS